MVVLPGMLFRAKVTAADGSATTAGALDAAFLRGVKTAQINTLGTGVDGVTTPGSGKVVIHFLDTTNLECICSFITSQSMG
jgi:hypothetical protein